MMIKHIPNGLSPYYDCGYQRNPYYVHKGDEVWVNIRISECAETTIAHLVVRSEDGSVKKVEGKRLMRENDDRVFFAFELGKFEKLEEITYQIYVESGIETFNTKEYRFEVLEWVEFLKPQKLYKLKDKMIIEYEEKCNLKPCYVIQKEVNSFSVVLTDAVPTDGAQECLEAELRLNEFKLIVEMNPFSIILFNDEELLMKWSTDDSCLRLSLNKKGDCYKVDRKMLMKGNGFFGLGEKFDKVNQIGLEPKSWVFEQFTNQKEKTYLPIPFIFTEKGYGLFSDTSYFSSMQVGESDNGYSEIKYECECSENEFFNRDYLMLGTPKEMIKTLHLISGNPILPPKWTFGPWISSNGWNTQAETIENVMRSIKEGIPASVLVLEAWSDEENFYIYNGATYEANKDMDELIADDYSYKASEYWPDPKEMGSFLQKNNINLVLWQIPIIKHTFGESHGKQLDNDEDFAVKNGYCILNDDGTPYRITDNWFHNSLLIDFTNPEASKWWFDKRKYLLTDMHVKGFKTDGGEFLFDYSSKLKDGTDGKCSHNLYPNMYIGAYNEFCDKYLGKGNGVTFSRAGFTGIQKYPIVWAGDQLSTFSEFRSHLTAGLSAGLSGVIFWSFDIGGFAGQLPSSELYIRSSQMAALAPIMQYHSEPRQGQFFMTDREQYNNDRTPWNIAQINDDDSVIRIYRKYANFRMNLLPYLYNEAKFCTNESRPMMAHLIYDYPNDNIVINIEDEYMLGRSILVAPIIIEGQKERSIYLPEGTWYSMIDGTQYNGNKHIEWECKLSDIPVFIRDGSVIPINMNENFIIGTEDIQGYMGNSVEKYDNFGFVMFGEAEINYITDNTTIYTSKSCGTVNISTEGEVTRISIISVDLDELNEIIVNGNRAKYVEKGQVTVFDREMVVYTVNIST